MGDNVKPELYATMDDGRFVYKCEMCNCKIYRYRKIPRGKALCAHCHEIYVGDSSRRATEGWMKKTIEYSKLDIPEEYHDILDNALEYTIKELYDSKRKFGNKYKK